MKKPGLIKTTVRLFPDSYIDAATTRTTIKGHVISRMLKKGLDLYRSCIETWGKALDNGKKSTLFQLESQLSFLFNFGRSQVHVETGESIARNGNY
jgi:hypothetical protein